MRECPVEFSRLRVERTKLQWSVADPSYRDYLRVVSSSKNLVRLFEVRIDEGFLDNGYAGLAQQADDPLACNAGQKGSVRNRCEHHTILCHENVRGGEFGDVAQHVADDRIVEAPSVRLEESPRIIGIKTPGLG